MSATLHTPDDKVGNSDTEEEQGMIPLSQGESEDAYFRLRRNDHLWMKIPMDETGTWRIKYREGRALNWVLCKPNEESMQSSVDAEIARLRAKLTIGGTRRPMFAWWWNCGKHCGSGHVRIRCMI